MRTSADEYSVKLLGPCGRFSCSRKDRPPCHPPTSSPMPRPLWWIRWVNHHTRLASLLGRLTSHLLGFASSALAQRLWGFSEGDLCLPSVCLLQWLLISTPWAAAARREAPRLGPPLGPSLCFLSGTSAPTLSSALCFTDALYRGPCSWRCTPPLTTTLHIQGPRAPPLTPTKAHWVTL